MAAVAAAMVATASGSDVLALAAYTHQAEQAAAVSDPVLLGPEQPPGFDGWVVGGLSAWFSPPPAGVPAAPTLPKSAIPPPTAPIVAALGESGIPEVALKAYVHAAQSVAATNPSCNLDWSVLAAIGRVESNHGRFGGAKLRADGSTTTPIRGIALDGRPGVARILDSDDGVYDGDVTFDRAVGPMQFLPSTWRFVAADGNGDGATDPNNIFDATLGAARYLCAGGADLSNRAELTAAVMRYNHSAQYVALVLALAAAYHNGHSTLPPATPVSPAPPVTSPALPPVNVGPPPGLSDIGDSTGPTDTAPPATSIPSSPSSPPPSSSAPPTCPPSTSSATPDGTPADSTASGSDTTAADCPTDPGTPPSSDPPSTPPSSDPPPSDPPTSDPPTSDPPADPSDPAPESPPTTPTDSGSPDSSATPGTPSASPSTGTATVSSEPSSTSPTPT